MLGSRFGSWIVRKRTTAAPRNDQSAVSVPAGEAGRAAGADKSEGTRSFRGATRGEGRRGGRGSALFRSIAILKEKARRIWPRRCNSANSSLTRRGVGRTGIPQQRHSSFAVTVRFRTVAPPPMTLLRAPDQSRIFGFGHAIGRVGRGLQALAIDDRDLPATRLDQAAAFEDAACR